MAILVDTRTGHAFTLPARCLLGRSSACTLRVDDPRVSGEHARISWQGDRWEVRDLGSRNGTFLNDKRTEPSTSVVLAATDRIALGDVAVVFSLLDASPPLAQARQLVTGTILLARGGLLPLPSEDDPEATVMQDADGRWIVEAGGEARVVLDGEVLQVGSEAFALHLPAPMAPTVDARGEPPDIRGVGLRFRVSRDEERVEVVIELGPTTRVFAPRAHHYTLLTLARARFRDEEEGKLPEPSRGWIAVDELCRMLAIDENKLNVEVFRIRQDFGALDVQNTTAIVERRKGVRQLRLGTACVTIERPS
ncbi:FHA domain-containing protein [Polyangium sp. 6x1]|uniref:FHA domain-containing protein n=1 Tax=Polyangium sp. 6x1 TaxID=3042689 RepID=UPI0024831CDC|nr:FHA domain-containing protein [Polyangium sp. 6x1]MDI1446197.1 FHA domain-containing protein [Polyangium sp. 6x1]